jgi:uncharacterized membrane protein
MRKAGWVVMALLASGVALYALAILAVPEWGPPFVAERRASMPLPLFAHFIGGAWALGAGPWQFSQRLRDRTLLVHRWIGRSYVAGVLAGGVGALAMAPRALTGPVAGLGFGTLGVLWVAFTIVALARIRQGDRAAHRRWMIRSYALTLAAVTLRIYLPASMAAGVPFDTAYPAIAWLCWVPNLVAAELFAIRIRRGIAFA